MNEQTDRFKGVISVLIAMVTVWASVTAFLQAYASEQDAASDRRANKLSIEATQSRLIGSLQYSYDWQGAFQAWREVDLQVTSAEVEGDDLLAERYRKLREELRTISPLLQPPYFDGEPWTFPDTNKYEVDTYLVEATRLSEQFAAESQFGNEWSGMANAFVIQLALLAATLSLFGLSITLKGLMRALFVFIGSGIVLVNLAWTAILLLLPPPEVNLQAIDAYAQGYGQQYHADTEEDLHAALSLFDQAISADPQYANAYYERGNTHYSLGDFSNAITDYETAIRNGREDANVRWNLGWTYYLVGRYQDAYAINQAQIDEDSTLIGLRTNQALVLLASGDVEAAAREYQAILREAERQVSQARAMGSEPSAGLWFYLDAAALDLQYLLDHLNGLEEVPASAPPANLVLGDHQQVIQTALEQIRSIKEASVALEYAGKLPDYYPDASVSALAFGYESFDENGEYIGFEEFTAFPAGTSEVTVYFEYYGQPPQYQVLWKVFIDGIETRYLRTKWDVEGIEDGTIWVKDIGYSYTNIFAMPPAEYTVELYVDYRLMQTGTFFVQP